ncbi:hypothetical protein, partial [Escherichia coli]|uniref:hypothetical protein n=1 Tax=Escherichia coli TaxID=562 RepID=UPI00183B2A20
MSMSRDPRRLVEYGDKLDGLVRGALDAERAEAADAARLSGIEAKLAQRLAQLPHAPGPSASPSLPEASPAPTPAPAVDPLGSRAVW